MDRHEIGRPLHILGVNCHMHDSAVCLLRDGGVVGFAEEERFSRKKHSSDFPHLAIAHVLADAGVSLEEVDHVVYFWRPWRGLAKRAWIAAAAKLSAWRPRSATPNRSHQPKTNRNVISRGRTDILLRMLGVKRQFRSLGFRGEFHYADHHAAHLASAFCPSGFDEAAILIVDANGEAHTTVAARARGHRHEILERIAYPHSLGLLYLCVTEYLGFKENSGEGKVMGLAPYGHPTRAADFAEILRVGPGFRLHLDLRYFDVHLGRHDYVTPLFIDRFGPRRAPEGPIEPHHKDVAASLQAHAEQVILHLAGELQRRTGLKRLCLAGGVALNSAANGRLRREGLFDEIYVQPAANDAGTSMGAALLLHHFRLERPGAQTRIGHASWGPRYERSQLNAAVERLSTELENVDISRVEVAAEQAARDIAAGRIVGWFQGRMEVGPRALGNRSILADPRGASMKDHINARVKHREGFRPFTPAVLEERAAEYFEVVGPSPFMLEICHVRPEKRDEIPAVTHVDGTARLQTVDEMDAPSFHSLISAFAELTGTPVIVNTSFNVRGEPIVCNPEDAIRCFLSTGIDILYLEDLRLAKL